MPAGYSCQRSEQPSCEVSRWRTYLADANEVQVLSSGCLLDVIEVGGVGVRAEALDTTQLRVCSVLVAELSNWFLSAVLMLVPQSSCSAMAHRPRLSCGCRTCRARRRTVVLCEGSFPCRNELLHDYDTLQMGVEGNNCMRFTWPISFCRFKVYPVPAIPGYQSVSISLREDA